MVEITEEHLRRAFLAGFKASAEGNNGEYPYADNGTCPSDNHKWRVVRNAAVKELLAWEPPYCECQGVYADCGWQHYCR